MKVAVVIISLMLVQACIAKVIIEYENDSDESEYGTDEYYEDEYDLGLSYPSDCKSKTLRSFATKCGLKVSAGGSHYIVKDPKTNTQVTVIPHKVKSNGTCRSIIDVLNARCE